MLRVLYYNSHHLVVKVPQEELDLQDQPDQLDLPVLKVLQVHKVTKELEVRKVLQELLVTKEQLVQ